MTERITNFSEETKKGINYYVYRLVDPMTGQTFYVGKGHGDRVFDHIKAAADFYDTHINEFNLKKDDGNHAKDKDPVAELADLKKRDPAKLKMIKEIESKGLEVIHIIQRYGLTEREAFEIEAAFIDFFGLDLLTNEQKGRDSDRGMIWTDALEQKYMAQEFDDYPNTPNQQKFMIIKINDYSINLNNGDIYEAVRASWKINIERARKYPLVLAVRHGIVVGVYKVNKWENTEDGYRARFIGEKAEEKIRNYFLTKRIPPKYRKHQNPVSYCNSKMETKE